MHGSGESFSVQCTIWTILAVHRNEKGVAVRSVSTGVVSITYATSLTKTNVYTRLLPIVSDPPQVTYEHVPTCA